MCLNISIDIQYLLCVSSKLGIVKKQMDCLSAVLTTFPRLKTSACMKPNYHYHFLQPTINKHKPHKILIRIDRFYPNLFVVACLVTNFLAFREECQ